MKSARLLGAAIAFAAATSALAADITGAGATFPYPIYAKWADAYKKTTGNGMYLGELVEFGATDLLFLKPTQQATEDYITGRFG